MKRLCVTTAFVLIGYIFAFAAAVSPAARRITPRTSSLLKSSGSSRYHEEIRHFHEQRQRLSAQLQSIEQQLEGLGFSFGAQQKEGEKGNAEERPLEVALSTEEHPMSCRVLIEAEPGAKVIAPCNCQGTLKVRAAFVGKQSACEASAHARLRCDETVDPVLRVQSPAATRA
jgi:hypothetical protein